MCDSVTEQGVNRAMLVVVILIKWAQIREVGHPGIVQIFPLCLPFVVAYQCARLATHMRTLRSWRFSPLCDVVWRQPDQENGNGVAFYHTKIRKTSKDIAKPGNISYLVSECILSAYYALYQDDDCVLGLIHLLWRFDPFTRLEQDFALLFFIS